MSHRSTLKDRPDLGRESRHRFLVVWRRETGDEVAVADLKEWRKSFGHILRRPDRLILPAIGVAVALEHRGVDAFRFLA